MGFVYIVVIMYITKHNQGLEQNLRLSIDIFLAFKSEEYGSLY